MQQLSFSLIGSLVLTLSLASLGWDHLPLCTPAAYVCQPGDPSPFLAQTDREEKKEEEGEGEGLTRKTKVAPIEAKASHRLL